MRLRRPLAAAILLLLTTAGGLALAAPLLARRALARRGCTVASLGWSGPALVARDLACGPVTAHRLTLAWDGADLHQVQVRLAPPSAEGAAPSDLPGGGGLPARFPIRVSDLALSVGELTLAAGLSGTLRPLALTGEGASFQESPEGVALRLERELTHPHGAALATVTGTVNLGEGTFSGAVDLAEVRLHHPLLGPEPLLLGDTRLDLEGTLHPRTARGRLSLGGPVLDVTVDLAEGTPHVVVELPATAAAEVLAPLAPRVPELATARLAGTVGGRLEWGPAGVAAARLDLEGLQVQGALPPDLALVQGPFTWRARTAEGEWVPRRGGEGSPGWTPLAGISPHVIHAVLAAEDGIFHRHAGYQPAAIQSALEADVAAGRVVRGGSTITQQLAKNLFLDGTQTLVRKVRELLLAVELDRVLGKDRVLELYLNIAEWGPGIHGVGPAAECYFLKDPAHLDPLEGAFLASLLPSPRRGYARAQAGRVDRGRLADILQKMERAGWLTPAQVTYWAEAPLVLVPPPASASSAIP